MQCIASPNYYLKISKIFSLKSLDYDYCKKFHGAVVKGSIKYETLISNHFFLLFEEFKLIY